jgi:transposase-like protein
VSVPALPSCRTGLSLPGRDHQLRVWLYYRFSLSLRDVEELLTERGVTVTYETIRAWCPSSAQLCRRIAASTISDQRMVVRQRNLCETAGAVPT